MRANVIKVFVVRDFTLRCVFDDGSIREYDMKPRLFPIGLIADLLDPEFFAQAHVTEDGDVAWPNGADIGAYTLFHEGME